MSIVQYKRIAVVMVFILVPHVTSHAGSCELALWPTMEVAHSLSQQRLLSTNLRKQADKALRHPPAPVKSLRSAGVTDKNDPALKVSRRAFRDADNAAVVALAYAAFGEAQYFEYVRNTLLSWVELNIPTGHPIDETRLEGLLWAFDLVCSDLSVDDRTSIRNYFRAMRAAKGRWRFGPKTEYNNHKTHHLKMLILLDRVLNDEQAMAIDTAAARAHLDNNIDKETGVSIDYLERDALYYHVYNLEAWLEIAMLADCCVPAVRSAFRFTADKVLSNEIDGEFQESQAKIDRRRGQSGFEYAKHNGRYEVKRASRVIVSYSTLTGEPLDPKLWQLVHDLDIEEKLSFFFVRRLLWQNR